MSIYNQEELPITLERGVNHDADWVAFVTTNRRNYLLTQSDWTQGADSPLDADTKAAWATYRQELRDLPSQEGFPNVAFPTPPTAGE